MKDHLNVFRGRDLVGELEQDAAGRMSFRYSAEWLQSRSPFPVSLTLPLSERVYADEAQTFFSNLLPEADARRFLCARLKISPSNDFELLKSIGGECAGALTLWPGEPPEVTDEYRPLSRDALVKLARSGVLSSLDGQKGLRLSLAGAQDKLPVKLEGEAVLLPVGSAASTHILKFANPRFKHLPANEVLITSLARELGLPAVKAELWPLGAEGMCVVERYDRTRRQGGEIVRRHQEDLCQALAVPARQKYEKEGGPSYKACFERVRSASTEPVKDGRTLLRWAVFNALALNADGHAKNLSLLYDGGEARLAPLYDLVCTRAWKELDADLAMRVGGEADPTLLRRSHWEALASELGLGARFVTDAVRDLSERFADALEKTAAEFLGRYGGSPMLQRVTPLLRRQAKRILQQLA